MVEVVKVVVVGEGVDGGGDGKIIVDNRAGGVALGGDSVVASGGNPDVLKEMLDGSPIAVEPFTKVALRVYVALNAPRNTVMSDGLKVDDNVMSYTLAVALAVAVTPVLSVTVTV